MKNNTKRKLKTNVLNIADNKRFVEVAVPQTTETVQLLQPRFGYPVGSKLICRTDFDYSQIKADTLILLNVPDRESYVLAAGHYAEKDIYAVVEFVQIDVRRNNE